MTSAVKSVKGRTRLALVGVAMLTLTGCGQMHPGAAAVVGSDVISEGQVDALAKGLCSANLQGAAAGGGATPDLATRGARQGALQVLMQSELSRQFGQKRGVSPDQSMVSAALAQNAQGIARLPKSQRADFRQALKEYAEGQLMLIAVGRNALEAQGRSHVTDSEALAEGTRLRQQYVKSVDVSVDPRFGTFKNGSLRQAGGDLSVPVSDSARAGNSANPSATWVSSLPASQKCS